MLHSSDDALILAVAVRFFFLSRVGYLSWLGFDDLLDFDRFGHFVG